jgi:hypothetical protein
MSYNLRSKAKPTPTPNPNPVTKTYKNTVESNKKGAIKKLPPVEFTSISEPTKRLSYLHSLKPSDEKIALYKNIDSETVIDDILTKPDPKAKKYFNHYNNVVPYSELECDLLFLPEDQGYNYCLTLIDTASRYKWGQPLKSKTSHEVLEAFKKMTITSTFQTLPIDLKKVQVIYTDAGGEFSSVFAEYLRNNNIIQKKSPIGYHLSMVERLNLELARKIFKIQAIEEYETKQTVKSWINIFQHEIYKLNHQITREINMKPIDAIKMDKVPQRENKFTKEDELKHYGAGTIVRALLSPEQYLDVANNKIKKENRRGTDPYWTTQLYYVCSLPNKKLNGIAYHSIIPIEKAYSSKNIMNRRYTYWQLKPPAL